MGLSRADAAHLLRRTGFAPTTTEIDRLVGLSRSDAVARVLDRTSAPPTPRPISMNEIKEWKKHVRTIEWWIDRMITTPTPIVERMALFWHNHFACGQDKVNLFEAMWTQNQLFRSAGLGNFRDLCQQVSVGSAMLVYLDNADNVAGAVQENFGRELLELFTCGVGNYTEEDVVSCARAWTGHNIVGWTGTYTDKRYLFRPDQHDNGPKRLFGITRNWDGPEVIDELCYGRRADATARHIARKLFEFFARPNPPAAVVDHLAARFRAADLSIEALLRAVLLHDEFWAPASRRSLVKWPVDYVADLCRITGYPVERAAPHWTMQSMGQILFQPPDVSGWKHNEYWLSTATACGRAELASSIRWATDELDFMKVADDRTLDPAVLVDRCLAAFHIEDAGEETRTRLRDFVVDARRRFAWYVRYGLFLLIAVSPEFQTR